MMMKSNSTWQRARSPDQISQRTATILEAAGEVFSEMPYEKVTMRLIANRANFTRSNLYRYFNTREEIFLTLFRSDVDAWMNEMNDSFDLSSSVSIDSFVSLWTDILLRQKRLLRLSPLLAISLEKHVTERVYRDFKISLKDMALSVFPVFKKALTGFNKEAIGGFLLFNLALVAGAWPMSQYSEMQRSVLSEPDLSWMKMDFKDFLQKSIAAYLRGIR